jgi:hypothetical protein
MRLTVATGVSLVLLSASHSPSGTEASKPPADGDLSLRPVKVNRLPPCTVYMLRSQVQPTNIGLPNAVVAFKVDGLPNTSGATVALTSPPDGTNAGVVARFNPDGTLRDGDGVRLDGAPKVTYYAFPVDLRRLYNKTVSFTLAVDPDNKVEETNEKNNVLKLRLTTRGVVGPPDLTKGYPSGAGNRCAKVS